MKTERVIAGFNHNLTDSTLQILHGEFYKDTDLRDYKAKMSGLLSNSASDFLTADLPGSRGADVFVVHEEGTIEGVSELRYYDWENLRNQLYIRTFNSCSNIQELCLVRFEDLVSTLEATNDAVCAVEFASLWVDPNARGKGIGNKLIESSLGFFDSNNLGKTVYFGIVRGVCAEVPDRSVVFETLLENERKNSDIGNQKIPIQSHKIPFRLVEEVGFTQDSFSARQESKPAQLLLQRNGFKQIGFTKFMSPVLAKIK